MSAIFSILVLWQFSAVAQVKGVVVDNMGSPVDGVAVVALQLPDSVYIGGTVSDTDGRFFIKTEIDRSSFLVLTAEGIGYVKCTQKAVPGENKIVLRHSSLELGEVVVKAPCLTVSPGKFSFYPGDIINDVNDAFSVLKYVPLIRVEDTTDDISLLGKPTKILINGKEPIIASNGLVQMLRGSDAARVKRVEIIVQPDVTRQDEGPIINLILAPRTGSMGAADVTFTYSDPDQHSSRIGSWYGGEWERYQFFANISFFHGKDQVSSVATYTQNTAPAAEADGNTPLAKSSEFSSSSDRYNLAGSLGASVDLRHDNSLSAYVMMICQDKESHNHYLTNFMPGGRIDDIGNLSAVSFVPNWVLGRLNYDQTLDSSGSTLRASALYEGNFNHNSQSYTPVDAMQAYRSWTDINSIQLQGAWCKQFDRKLNIDLGLDAFYDNVSRQLRRSKDGTLDGELIMEDDLMQRQYQADLFGAVEYKFSDLFAMSLGIRSRWYHRVIDQYVQRESRTFHDFYLIPLLSASFTFNPMHIVTLGYTSSVEQPEYNSTNPISYWLSPDYYYTGNPDLRAARIHNLNLHYILIQKINFGATAVFKDNITQWATLPAGDGVTFYKPLGIGRSRELDISTGYSDAFFSHRWGIYANASYRLVHLDNKNLPAVLANGPETNSEWDLYLSTNVTVGRDRSWSFDLTLFYKSPVHTTFANRNGYCDMNASVAKQFRFGGRIILLASNLLNHRISSWYDCAAYSQDSRNFTTQRSIILKFEFSFGKSFRRRHIPSDGGLGNRM